MRALLQSLIRFFLFPGEWVADRFGVTRENNRDLVRMLVNYLFWGAVATIGLAIWTSTLPIYR